MMRRMTAAIACLAGAAMAEVRDEEFVAGDQLVRIEALDGAELMWVGANEVERLLVLTGPDIEIAAFATDDDSAAMLGKRAVVAVVPGTHSCENLGDPQDYYVVTLGEPLATDGPLTTCAELTVSVSNGALVLEADPMGGGDSWRWMPGQGFETGAN
jgi:hypothetical protein